MSLALSTPGPRGPEDSPYTGRLRWTPRGPVRIGLLANGFPDSVPFLEAVGKALEAAFPQITTQLWDKGNASITASDALVRRSAQRATGSSRLYGHWGGSCTTGHRA